MEQLKGRDYAVQSCLTHNVILKVLKEIYFFYFYYYYSFFFSFCFFFFFCFFCFFFFFFFFLFIFFFFFFFFFFQAEDGIRDKLVTGVQTCGLPICCARRPRASGGCRDRGRRCRAGAR